MSKTKTILRALAGETLPVPPIWMMRQAGRYLPEYKAKDFMTEASALLVEDKDPDK